MNEEQIVYLPLDQIEAAPQVRTDFGDESLHGLADTMAQVGQLQPIRVRRDGDIYVVVAGERRLRAARLSGRFTTIAAIIEEGKLDSAAVLTRQLVENCTREDLKPLEKARAIKELMMLTSKSAGETASMLGLSAATVSKLLSLMDLPEPIQTQIRDGAISASTAYELGKIENAAEQAGIAAQIAAGQMTRDAVSRAARRKKPPRAETDAKPASRIKAELSGGRSVTLAGPKLDSVETMIEWLEELLGRARKCRPKSLRTFLAILKDEARA